MQAGNVSFTKWFCSLSWVKSKQCYLELRWWINDWPRQKLRTSKAKKWRPNTGWLVGWVIGEHWLHWIMLTLPPPYLFCWLVDYHPFSWFVDLLIGYQPLNRLADKTWQNFDIVSCSQKNNLRAEILHVKGNNWLQKTNASLRNETLQSSAQLTLRPRNRSPLVSIKWKVPFLNNTPTAAF